MTDDEAYDLLTRLATKRLAERQRANHELGDSLLQAVWDSRPEESALTRQGATPEQAAFAMAKLRSVLEIRDEPAPFPMPESMALNLAEELELEVSKSAVGPQRLDEKLVKWVTEYRIDIYPNEGQHRGCPHVSVKLPDGKISIALDDVATLLTKHVRGAEGAQKVVLKNRDSLLAMWEETRPDDQRLPKPQA